MAEARLCVTGVCVAAHHDTKTIGVTAPGMIVQPRLKFSKLIWLVLPTHDYCGPSHCLLLAC